MPSVVRSYWTGALRRLQAEVDGLAKLVAHRGEQGRENELALARVLSSLVPRRFGTGSGLLIDALDHQSAQVDVVIFEQAMEAALFAQTTQLLFPIETVYAGIEVKTTLRAEDIAEFGVKTTKLLALEPQRQHADGSSRPLNCLFAYSAWALPGTVMTHLRDLDPELRPDAVCVVDQGLIAGRPEVVQSASLQDNYSGGLTCLYDRTGSRVVPTGTQVEQVDGSPYTVLRLGKENSVLVDAARGLLLFLEALLRGLHAKADGRDTVLSLYLDEDLRRLDDPGTAAA